MHIQSLAELKVAADHQMIYAEVNGEIVGIHWHSVKKQFWIVHTRGERNYWIEELSVELRAAIAKNTVYITESELRDAMKHRNRFARRTVCL